MILLVCYLSLLAVLFPDQSPRDNIGLEFFETFHIPVLLLALLPKLIFCLCLEE